LTPRQTVLVEIIQMNIINYSVKHAE